MLERFQKALSALERRGRLRSLAPPSGVDFASNDYLALSASQSLRDFLISALHDGAGVGAGASRLLRGNHPAIEELEQDAAVFFQSEAALFVGSGYAANQIVWSTLPRRGDLIVLDELSHASTREGIAASKAASVAVHHNDPALFETALRNWRTSGATGQGWIAVESLYSMDGDRAPLSDLIAIAERYEAVLVIDEAHATGVFGSNGRGLAAELEGRTNVVTVHTCGKAIGVMGAFICCPAVIKDFIVNRARSFIYATAPSPLIALAVGHALTLLQNGDELRARLHGLIQHGNRELQEHCGLAGSGSQIVPVILGSDHRATEVARTLQSNGYDVRAIRPPTVPEGTARLRISLTLNASKQETTQMLQLLGTTIGGAA